MVFVGFAKLDVEPLRHLAVRGFHAGPVPIIVTWRDSAREIPEFPLDPELDDEERSRAKGIQNFFVDQSARQKEREYLW
jgi:hypothetical protein